MSNDTEAMVGSEMLLDCAVTGNPPAEVLWLTPRYVYFKQCYGAGIRDPMPF